MEKDNKNEVTNQKDNAISSALVVFIKDPKSWYLYKKSEKISKAFFLLTRHLSDEHMLKNRMREKALDLMCKAQALLSNTKPAPETSYIVVLEALSLISLSDTALAAELQSERNHTVVVRELENFITDLSTWAREKAVSAYIPTSLFDMSDITTIKSEASAVLSTTASIFGDVSKTSAQGHIQRNHHTNVHKQGNLSNKNSNMQASNKVNYVRPDLRKDSRQEAIIQAVRVKKEVSIKDLVAVVKGCSEKTIQRELTFLVNAGIVSKTGERRWSRYTLI